MEAWRFLNEGGNRPLLFDGHVVFLSNARMIVLARPGPRSGSGQFKSREHLWQRFDFQPPLVKCFAALVGQYRTRVSATRPFFPPQGCSRIQVVEQARKSRHKSKREESKNMSATDSKKATSASINKYYQEGLRSYEEALKAAIQLQEESANLWKDVLSKLGYPQEFQAKLESMTADAFPKARERMEEFFETFNRTSNQTIDVFDKMLSIYNATSVPDAQRRVQDLIESSLTALRVNLHSTLDMNAKIIGDWKELVDERGHHTSTGQRGSASAT
jgi:hypothetical protein